MFRQMRRFKQQMPEEDGYPYAMPLDFLYDEESGNIYFHGAKAGYKIDALRKSDKVCFVLRDEVGTPSEDWWLNYRSVIIFGRIHFMEQSEESDKILRRLGLKYYPTPESVEKVMKSSASRTQMLKLEIEHITGKYVQEE